MTKFLIYLIATAFFLSIWHLLYESVIAPTLRMHLRNKLFEQRDALRKEYVRKNLSLEDQEISNYVHDGINRFLNRLSSLNLIQHANAVKAFEKDALLLDRISKRLDALNSCKNKEILRIWNSTNKIVAHALLVNTGAWIIYLIPVFLVYFGLSRLSESVSELIIAPSYAIKSILPEPSEAFRHT
ncbi:MAG: hypothetical protein EOP04_09060 [Proteobacteria bacterium]|nr:MAG: hypothetical protein EOP04_09060 [Pseudomonadota bacterium]